MILQYDGRQWVVMLDPMFEIYWPDEVVSQYGDEEFAYSALRLGADVFRLQ